MQDLLPPPELLVEGDGGIVAVVGLTKMTQAPRSVAVALRWRISCVAIPRRRNGSHAEIVDVDLATRLFELVEFIGDESPDCATTATTCSLASSEARYASLGGAPP